MINDNYRECFGLQKFTKKTLLKLIERKSDWSNAHFYASLLIKSRDNVQWFICSVAEQHYCEKV